SIDTVHLNQWLSAHRINQVYLQILLLEVDHGEKPVVFAMRVLHAVYALATVIGVTEAPRQSGLRHTMRDTYLLQNLHGSARKHYGSTAFGHLPFRFQDHGRYTMACKFQGQHQTGRAGTTNRHLAALRQRLPRGQPWFHDLVVVIDRTPRFGDRRMHDFVPTFPLCPRKHRSWSHSAALRCSGSTALRAPPDGRAGRSTPDARPA